MKVWRLSSFLALGIAAAMVVVPANASAKSGYFVEPPSVTLRMSLQGSHGYNVSITSFAHKFVLLSASKGSVSAEYAVRGRSSRHGVRANLGDLGRIALKFHGSRRPLPDGPPRRFKCKGHPPIHEVGRFEGVVRFNGEQGFTSVAASGARGSIVRHFRRVCKRPPWLRSGDRLGTRGRVKPSGVQLEFFVAGLRTRDRTVYVATVGSEIPAQGDRPSFSFTFVVASLQEQRGRVSISRSVFIEGDPGSVLADESETEPTAATVTLPKPFGGMASYAKEPGSKASLTGSLNVWLPGAGKVPLTGPDFKAAVCHASGYKQMSRCLRNVKANLKSRSSFSLAARPQGSGSHSQAFWDARLSWSR
jgi:hypothetical protein